MGKSPVQRIVSVATLDRLGALPSPLWGGVRGGGPEVDARLLPHAPPPPQPSPSRSRIYPTSAGLKCRTRVNPSSGGEGADRGRGGSARRSPLRRCPLNALMRQPSSE